jgi:hypothetical protein
MATKKSRRATDDALDALHLMTAEVMQEQLGRYKRGEVLDEAGNALPPPAALLTAILKFLKDNGVDRPVQPGDATDTLADDLPMFGDNVVSIHGAR